MQKVVHGIGIAVFSVAAIQAQAVDHHVSVGGASVRPLVERRARGSVVFDNSSAGVLALRFNARDFAWRYRTVDGFDIDAGRHACH